MNIRKAFAATVAAGAMAAAPFITATPAQAAGTDTQLGSAFTLAENAGLCAGNVRAWVTADPAGSGGAFFHVQALPFQGITIGGAIGTPCAVVAKLAWRNTATNASGLYQVMVFSGPTGSPVYSQFQPTGKGKITTELSTTLPNTPARGEFRS